MLFRSRWHVFTEFTVFTAAGRELRIDRLMIDEAAKAVEIIDYKTGETYAEEQMEMYVAAVADLPWLKENTYSIHGRFIEIHVLDQ